jgi:hypothetical protein
MGHACPVCETPHPDPEHLANHLAFTAMLGDEAHEAWLDEHATGWQEQSEDELADRVAEYGGEVGFPQVFDDTTHDHDHGDEPRGGDLFEDELERANGPGREPVATGAGAGAGALDGEAQQILREAREMTEQLLDGDGADDGEGGNRETADRADESE